MFFIFPLQDPRLSWCEESSQQSAPHALSKDVFGFFGGAGCSLYRTCPFISYCLISVPSVKYCSTSEDDSNLLLIKRSPCEDIQSCTQANLAANKHNKSGATSPLDTGEILISSTCKWKIKKVYTFLSSKLLLTEGSTAEMETGQSASEEMESLDVYSFFLLLLLCIICSTKLHLTEVDIYKPSASGAIKTWLISRVLCSILIVCVLKAIGRRQDSCVSLCKMGESALGRSSMWGKWCFKGNIRRRSCLLHKEPPSASIKEVNIVL